jgi:hypothetical protein
VRVTAVLDALSLLEAAARSPHPMRLSATTHTATTAAPATTGTLEVRFLVTIPDIGAAVAASTFDIAHDTADDTVRSPRTSSRLSNYATLWQLLETGPHSVLEQQQARHSVHVILPIQLDALALGEGSSASSSEAAPLIYATCTATTATTATTAGDGEAVQDGFVLTIHASHQVGCF